MPEGDLAYFKEVATINKTVKFLKDNAGQGISRVSPLILKYDAFGRCAHEPDTLCS